MIHAKRDTGSMLHMSYRRPGTSVRDLIGSYYCVSIPEAVKDVMRAEIANVRFILSGAAITDVNGQEERYTTGAAMLCGPTQTWSNISFEPGTHIFGAAVTPKGWARMFDTPAFELADKFVPLADHVSAEQHVLVHGVFDADGIDAHVRAADRLFAALDQSDKKINSAFLDAVTTWLTNPEPNELDDLLAAVDLSPRQIERLAKHYFGSPPKKLHRKFRALHSANRLAWEEASNWQEAATTAYFDQSHFIREFKEFNGRTPREFLQGAHLLVRQTLTQRRQIEHHSPYSLVG
jgi:methylphosphotriester-DNA--protein-cysteine methyltransferase